MIMGFMDIMLLCCIGLSRCAESGFLGLALHYHYQSSPSCFLRGLNLGPENRTGHTNFILFLFMQKTYVYKLISKLLIGWFIEYRLNTVNKPKYWVLMSYVIYAIFRRTLELIRFRNHWKDSDE